MTFPCITINDLAEFQFIAGTKQVLTFDILDSTGTAVNLSSANCSWQLSQYGDSTSLLTISGSISASPVNRFTVTIPSASTFNLSGKFLHQPVVVDYLGNEFRPSQGVITITKRIA